MPRCWWWRTAATSSGTRSTACATGSASWISCGWGPTRPSTGSTMASAGSVTTPGGGPGLAGREAQAAGGDVAHAAAGGGRRPGVLLVVENHSVPADRRVWGEAQSLHRAGYLVTVICPRGRHADREPYEMREGVAIHRFPTPFEGRRRLNYLLEYGWALLACFAISLRVWATRGFDVVHVGNPPDIFFPMAWFYKLFG